MNDKRNETRHLRSFAVLAVLFCAFSALAAPVRVKVFESADANGATYSYRVENTTTQPIVAVRIGFDYLHGEAQLHALPTGWTAEQGVPASSTTSPQGWTARLVTTEESNVVDMEWSSDQGSQFDIAPGATGTGFGVRLPQVAAEYRATDFDVILGDSTHVYGAMEAATEPPPPPTDTTPPTLTVSLSPSTLWPANHKMVKVTATITVSDNMDSHPSVQLVSITCSEACDPSDIAGAAFGTDDREFSLRADRTGQRKEGRVYTVTYSATDVAGNRVTVTATVTVPHDQRR